MIRRPDFDWIVRFCRLHRPPLVPITWYPPSGNPDGGHLDAIIGMEGSSARIAVEVTRCYRGDRASGEAKIEEQLLDRFSAWLRDVTVACFGNKGYRFTFTVYLSQPLTALVPRLKAFLKSPQEQQLIRAVIEDALREAERSKYAAMTEGLPDSAFFHRGSQVYVEPIVPADAAEVDYKFEEPAQGQWRTVIPMSFWTNAQAIVDAIADKRVSLPKYRELANASNAHALWLLLVVEQSSGCDVLAALHGDNRDRLNAILEKQPQFDEIYLLCKGPGPPQGWDLRHDGFNDIDGPAWELCRLWPKT